MESFPLAVTETRVSGRPTDTYPSGMALPPDTGAVLTSDMVALRGLMTMGCSPDLLPNEKLPTTSLQLKPRGGVTPDWTMQLEEVLSQVHRSRVLAEGTTLTFDQFRAKLTASNVHLTAQATNDMYVTVVHQ